MNWREANRPRGSIGSEAWASITTKATISTTPSAPTAHAAAPPPAGPSMAAKASAASPAETVTAPAMSIEPCSRRSLDSGTWRSVMATATAAMGTLMRKISRHDHAWTSQPPMKGPTALATPASADQAPTAWPRSSGWNDAEMIARLPGTRSAPPAPCRARAKVSQVAVGARAHRTDATVKATRPITNIRRRP